jgi:nitrous oxide reductase accessory protein NosL
MKRLVHVAIGVLTLVGTAAAQVPDDVRRSPSCKQCGMDREKFAHSRMLLEYEGGAKVAVCSLHCAARDLAVSMDGTPRAILVADASTRKLINAQKAVWVLGGSKPGVMTKRPKWAFEDRASADAFVKENGGTVAGFREAIRAAYEDLDQGAKELRDQRNVTRPAAVGASAPAPARAAVPKR